MKNREKKAGELFPMFCEGLRELYTEPEIRAILYRLFDHALGWSRATVQLRKGEPLPAPILTVFLAALERLSSGEPVQYITGSTEFCGLTIFVRSGVFIPRPETEELAVLVTRENHHLRNTRMCIVDFATGSGCLALAMKRAFPRAIVTGLDSSQTALEVARENALANNLEVTFIRGDLLDPCTIPGSEPTDIILCNPPYVPEYERNQMSTQVRDHEPAAALFVPTSHPLVFYEAIASLSAGRLAPTGHLYVEIHEEQAHAVSLVFREAGLTNLETFRDVYGKDRFIRASAPVQ